MVCERREASACLIMLSAKQGSHWYHFYNVFGMSRPGIDPTPILTYRTQSGRSTTWAIAAVYLPSIHELPPPSSHPPTCPHTHLFSAVYIDIYIDIYMHKEGKRKSNDIKYAQVNKTKVMIYLFKSKLNGTNTIFLLISWSNTIMVT